MTWRQLIENNIKGNLISPSFTQPDDLRNNYKIIMAILSHLLHQRPFKNI